MNSKTKVIAIVNQKGGVGKTTTTANLGAALTLLGKKVLLIDADPQGDLTDFLGYKQPDELEVTLATTMHHVISEAKTTPEEGILRHKEGFDLMPCNLDLSTIEMSLVNVMNREKILKEYIDSVKDNYDYVLIDCMPSLGMITINVLAASDSVIIPVQAHYLPARGMTQLLKSIEKVRKYINPQLRIDGILLTLVDNRTNLSRQIERELQEKYGSLLKIFDSRIPTGITAAETPAVGESIFTYDKSGLVAQAYMTFAKEVDGYGEKAKLRNRIAEVR